MIRVFFCTVLIVFSVSMAREASAAGLKYAKNGPSMDDVNVVRAQIGDFIHALKGVNGSGISACEATSGVPFYQLPEAVVKKSEFVNCLTVSTEEQASKDALDVLFPIGSKFMGIFIPVEQVGKIVLQAQ